MYGKCNVYYLIFMCLLDFSDIPRISEFLSAVSIKWFQTNQCKPMYSTDMRQQVCTYAANTEVKNSDCSYSLCEGCRWTAVHLGMKCQKYLSCEKWHRRGSLKYTLTIPSPAFKFGLTKINIFFLKKWDQRAGNTFLVDRAASELT